MSLHMCYKKKGRVQSVVVNHTLLLCTTKPQENSRGAACSNPRPQPGAKTFGGLEGGGGGRWVGQSAAGVPGGGGGSVGTPTYIPQNDPHDALIILNIHKWGKKNFQKKFAH